jgi:enamine deaminase RidA (YjgF/YER057c/UK114 family)
MKRQNFSSGAPFEERAGYSRAVKVGDMVFVGGTTSTNAKGDVDGGGNAYLQTKIILEKIAAALRQAGAGISDVVKVRFYVTDIGRAQEYLKAYSEWFKEIKPVLTMAEVKALARVDHLVEIEADAVVGSYLTSRLT